MSFPSPNINTPNYISMKASTQRLFLVLTAAVVWTLVGSSCRTIRGLGQDIEHAASGE